MDEGGDVSRSNSRRRSKRRSVTGADNPSFSRSQDRVSQLAQPASYDTSQPNAASLFTINLGHVSGETDDARAAQHRVYASPADVNVDVHETSFTSSQYSHTGKPPPVSVK